MTTNPTSKGPATSSTAGDAHADDSLITSIERYLALDEMISRVSGGPGGGSDPERLEEICRAMDALDLDALWATKPRTRAGALALLRLLQRVGWQCCHPADGAPQREAIAGIVALIETWPNLEQR